MRSICIYCGSQTGNDPRYETLARKAGEGVARAGRRLVYGGGEVGLMGVAARAALAAGGPVLGVIPEFMIPNEGAQEGVELRKVATMAARKAMMIEEADAFLVLPGGTGTLEEVFDLVSRMRLNQRAKPVVFADDDYWGPLKALLDRMVESGFAPGDALNHLVFANSIEEALDRIREAAPA